MSRFTPRPAVRKGQKARVGLAGPSGSGKTWTALEAATVLAEGKPILVLDTERGSASLYADYFDFEVIEWEPPYDPRELAEVVTEQAPNYGVIVPDSLSHFWEAEGGTRDIVDAAAARARGNSFAGWKEGTPAQNDLYAALLMAPCHVIVTMRSKTEYVLEERNGKQVPRKIGMAPIQRAGIEYEFTVTADLDYEHTLLVDKTRCHPLAGRMFKMGHTSEMAETLRDWLGSAEPMADHATVQRIVGMFARFPEGPERGQAKALFTDAFGLPQTLTAAAATEAESWLAERFGQIGEDTNEGAGEDGSDGGGDAALSSDGAHSHDVGRTEPESAPATTGDGEGPALHGSSPEPHDDRPIDAYRFGIRAHDVFEAAVPPEKIPHRKKTWLLKALRHALIYACTDGEASGAKDASGTQLFEAWNLLGDIESGAVTFEFNASPTAGVEWKWVDGSTSSVSWTELTLAEADAEVERRAGAA